MQQWELTFSILQSFRQTWHLQIKKLQSKSTPKSVGVGEFSASSKVIFESNKEVSTAQVIVCGSTWVIETRALNNECIVCMVPAPWKQPNVSTLTDSISNLGCREIHHETSCTKKGQGKGKSYVYTMYCQAQS